MQFVSGNFFRTLGVSAAMGRTLQPDDDRPTAPAPVAMISDRFWRRAFGADPAVTTRTVRLNGQPFAIVGVTPSGFVGMDPAAAPDMVLPISALPVSAATANPLQNPGLWNVCRVVARLRPDVAEEAARVDAERWVGEAVAAHPPPAAFDRPRILLVDGSRGTDGLRDATATPLATLLVVVGVLLLAACANIAGLLLARGHARQREMATRLALGAPRARLVRQLVTESLVLSISGGTLGVALAYGLASRSGWFLSQFMPTLFGANRSLAVTATPDLRVLALATVVSVGCGLLFGLVPALRATRVDLIATIRQHGTSGGRVRFGLTQGQAMVAAQSALAMLLLIGAGLLLRTVSNLRSVDMGFATDHLLYARIEPRSGGITAAQRPQFFASTLERVAALPGVQKVSVASSPPLGGEVDVGATPEVPLCLPNAVPGDPVPRSAVNSVAPNYFATLGVPLLRGRDFTWGDGMAGRPIIVNEAFAQAVIGTTDVVGTTVRMGLDCARAGESLIIAVVANHHAQLRVTGGFTPMLFFPVQASQGPMTVIVRTAGDPQTIIPTVRRAVMALNVDTPTFSEAPLADLRERQFRREQLLTQLLVLFGGVTVTVCALGIYGTLSYAVARRRSEIGIRMAIGARASDVVRLIVAEALAPVGMGIAAGLVGALVVSRVWGSLLYGVGMNDFTTLAGATVVFLAVTVVATAIPARAATAIDPTIAMRPQG